MKNKNGFFTFYRIILLVVLIFVTAFPAQAQKRDAEDWSIADYFKNLPEEYITAYGDYAYGRPTAEYLVVDEKNGYAVQMDSPPAENYKPHPTFEMALFKSQTKPPLLVVSNRQNDYVSTENDHVCNKYETFFLRRVSDKWTEVKREVLPAMSWKIFWDKPQSAERLTKIVEGKSPVTYHFEPPRQGTRMKVSLEICDYIMHDLDNTPSAMVAELRKLVGSAKSVYFEWDKQNGKFKLAK